MEVAVPKSGAQSGFARDVLSEILGDGRAVRLVVSATLLQSLFSLVGPWASSKAIDTALPDRAVGMLAILGLLSIAAALHAAAAAWLRDKTSIVLESRLEEEALPALLNRLLKLPFGDHHHDGFGSANQTLEAAKHCTSTITNMAVGFSTSVCSAIVTLVVLAVYYPLLAVPVVASTALAGGLAMLFARREARLATEALTADADRQQWFHLLLLSIAPLRVSGATERTFHHWVRLLEKSTRTHLKQMRAQVSRDVVGVGLPQLMMLGVTAWLAMSVMRKDSTLGEMMMATMLLGSFVGNASALLHVLGCYRALGGALERVDSVLSAPLSASRSPIDNQLDPSSEAGIELRNVWFRYRNAKRWVLQDYSAFFPSGKVSKLKAPSGAGKSTILRLVAGLLEPTRGEVEILGRAPHRHTRLVTYLPQQANLIEASIANNLHVLSGVGPRQIDEIAELTGLNRLVASLPMGLETLVSAHGGNLSAGQCQLIMLTGAFAQGTPVLLLDEATSQMDAASRAAIDWDALTQGRAVIIVEHD